METSVFTPVKITPLPRRGSPLILILRGILVAVVAMGLLAPLAAYEGSETLGAPLPESVQTEQTSVVPQPPEENNYGKDSPLSIPSDAACTGPCQALLPALERLPQGVPGRGGSPRGQATWARGQGDVSGQESGEAALDANLIVNYANQIAMGSPLIFGGTQCPRPDHTDAWDKEAEVGVTMLRQDWFLNDYVPDSTVEDYKNNVNNIQDPSTWSIWDVQWIADKFINAQSRGMKLMAIVDYAPHWLTYSGTQHGIPKDWWVWEDIVKKAYLHFRNQYGIEFDYIEVWNEPSAQFLDVTNSGMTRAEAYKAIYYHTWQAIQEVDPHIPIGGPADYAPYETEVLEAMLQDGNINNKIDFVSYHYYDDTAEWMVGDDPPERFIADLLQAYGREDIPVMLSEYNGSCCGTGRVNSVDESISYIGDKFVWLLKRGFLAANYFSLTAYCGAHGVCYYDCMNGQAQLKPQAKTWRLASKNLGLGDGPSKVMETTHSNSISAVGAINVSNQYVVLIANDRSGTKIVRVTLQNLGLSGQVEVEAYLASSANDATQPVISDIRTVQDGTLSLAIDMPAWSVVGIKLSDSGQPTPPPAPTGNVLENSSFEEGGPRPDGWTGKSLTLKDKRVCRKARKGSCSFKMVGTRVKKSLMQMLNISGSAGDGFTLSAWSRAKNPSPAGGVYSLQATVFHTDGTKRRYKKRFAKRTHDWQLRKKTFTITKDYSKIVVFLRYQRQSGKAWFDNVRLIAH